MANRKKLPPIKRRGRKKSLSGLDTTELLHAISQRRQVLETQREELQDQLKTIEAELSQLNAFGSNGFARAHRGSGLRRSSRKDRGRTRPNSLASILHRALQGQTLNVPQMMEAALKAGHKSKSKNFRTIVNLAMLNNRKLFRRVSRGMYTAK